MKKITADKVANWLPIRDKNTYKNKLGQILCIGGNAEMGGAIILSASAALYAGAGLVTVASAPENVHALHAHLPEAMFTNMYEKDTLAEQVKNAEIIVLGPGLGRDKKAFEVFNHVLNSLSQDQWLVLDADGLYHFTNNNHPTLPTENVVLTPHLGEWNNLTGITPPAKDIEKNQQTAQTMNAIVVLKKARTEIYTTDEVWKNTSGNPAMATGGMGDTLTGVIASLLGQFEHKKEAILSAIYIHSGAADELAETHYVTLPHEVIQQLPIFMKKLANS